MAGAFFELWFASRYLHVASIALLVGGASLACVVCAWPLVAVEAAAVVGLAYEWMFWTVVGITALTGISNLGLKGDGLLDAQTTWGTALTVKLALVLTLLAMSFVRTNVVRRWCDGASRRAGGIGRILMFFYGGTAAAILSIAWLGLGLAHGRY